MSNILTLALDVTAGPAGCNLVAIGVYVSVAVLALTAIIERRI